MMSGLALLELAARPTPHAEVLRWQGLRAQALGDAATAVTHLQAAAALHPHDFRIRIELATALDRALRFAEAAVSLDAAAAAAANNAADWLELSLECDRQGHYERALAAADQCLHLLPDHPTALLQRIRCNKALGHAEPAAADCRRLIALGQHLAKAWFSLVDLKTVRLTPAEQDQLARTTSQAAGDRLLLDYALGNACEAAGDHRAALDAFTRANAAASLTERWNAADFEQQVAAVRSAFEGAVAAAEPRGSELLFLVGLPRSGTTLVEQVLASHSQVEGASELPYLRQVVDEESWRRNRPFPGWVAQAAAADWTRLGQRYLQLSARWRLMRPVSTDKLPSNWLLAGAIRAMLPQARIVDCRRNPLETCWSCYKQRFAPGLAGFSYDFGDLANYWHAYDALCRHWALQRPLHLRVQHYEALVREPETEIRALLEFCGLPFEAACLTFQSAQRAIRTPSALQVRQPLKAASTPAAGYGALLDPLRRPLAATGID